MGQTITSGQLQFGVPAKELRDAIRAIDRSSFRAETLQHRIKMSASQALELVGALVAAGWAEAAGGQLVGHYNLTQQGHQFSMARLTKPMKRAKAEALLKNAIEISAAINDDGTLPHYVNELHVFGSYLSDRSELGDLDLAADLQPRDAHMSHDDWHQWVQDYGYEHCKRGGFLESWGFAEQSVWRKIKQRSSFVSVHTLADAKQIGATTKLVFKASEIAKALRTSS